MKKYMIEFKWALIFSGSSLLWMLLERLLGFHSIHIDRHAVFTNLFAIPAVLIYILALRDKRKKSFSGSMTYLQGFITGLIITLFVTIISPLNQLIISTLITPIYFPNAIAYAVESGYMTMPEAESYFNLNSYIIQGLIGAITMGIATSAIVAVFTRSKKQ